MRRRQRERSRRLGRGPSGKSASGPRCVRSSNVGRESRPCYRPRRRRARTSVPRVRAPERAVSSGFSAGREDRLTALAETYADGGRLWTNGEPHAVAVVPAVVATSAKAVGVVRGVVPANQRAGPLRMPYRALCNGSSTHRPPEKQRAARRRLVMQFTLLI